MPSDRFQALIAQRKAAASRPGERQAWQSLRAPGMPLAIDPAALVGDLFGEAMGLALVDSVAVISITGPLFTRGDMWGQANYAEIRHAVAMAVESPDVRGIVLDVDSPGGDVSGNFDTAREIRALARAANKPLIGFASGKAASAAYGLLSAADHILVSDSAVVGSIGVITTIADESAMLEMMGIKVSIIASGDRKDDGHPAAPLSDEGRIAVQSQVNSLAARFFKLIAEHRDGSAATYEDLQAAQFVGADAIGVGLADQVGTLSDAIRMATGYNAGMPDRDDEESKSKATEDDDEMRAALVKATEDEDEEKAAKATRALAAYDAEEDDEEDDDESKSKAEDDDDAKSKAEDEDDDDAKSKAKAQAATTAKLAATVAKQDAKIAAMERREFFATRPDLPGDLIKSLSETPLDQIKKIVASIPKTPGKHGPAEPEKSAARGGTGTGYIRGPVNPLSAQMGLTETQRVVKSEGNTLQLGVTVPRENQ